MNPFAQWYPVVGLDSNSPVRVNFGGAPFVFDIAQYCRNAWDAVAGHLQLTVPQAMTRTTHPLLQKRRLAVRDVCWHRREGQRRSLWPSNLRKRAHEALVTVGVFLGLAVGGL